MQDALSFLAPALIGAVLVGICGVIVAVIWEKNQRTRQIAAMREAVVQLEDTQTILQWQRDFDRETIMEIQLALTKQGVYRGPVDGIPGRSTISAARSVVQRGDTAVLAEVVGPYRVSDLAPEVPSDLSVEALAKMRSIQAVTESRHVLDADKHDRARTRVSLRTFGSSAA